MFKEFELMIKFSQSLLVMSIGSKPQDEHQEMVSHGSHHEIEGFLHKYQKILNSDIILNKFNESLSVKNVKTQHVEDIISEESITSGIESFGNESSSDSNVDNVMDLIISQT
jgi:hypothetical protein